MSGEEQEEVDGIPAAMDYEELLSIYFISNKNQNEFCDRDNEQLCNNGKSNHYQELNNAPTVSNDTSNTRYDDIVFNCVPLTMRSLKQLPLSSFGRTYTILKSGRDLKRVGFNHCLILGRVISIDKYSKRTKYILDDATESLEIMQFHQNHKLYSKRLMQLHDQLENDYRFQINNTSLNNKDTDDHNCVENTEESNLWSEIQHHLQQRQQKSHNIHEQNPLKPKNNGYPQDLKDSLKNLLHLIHLQIGESDDINIGDSVLVYGKPIYFHDKVSLIIDGISVVSVYNGDGNGSNNIYNTNNFLNNNDLEIDFKDFLISFYQKLDVLTNVQC